MAGEKTVAVRLIAINDQFKQGMKDSAGSVEGLAKSAAGSGSALLGIAGVAATVGLAVGAMAVKAADSFEQYGLQVSKIERLTGDSAEQSSALAFQFQQVGISADQGSTLLGRFARNVATAADPMAKFGFNTRDAQGQLLPMSTLLGKVADQFAGMPDGTEKTALAITDFGRSGAQLIPFLDKGSKGLADLTTKARQFGLVLSQSDVQAARDAVGAQRDWNASLQGLQVTIGRDVLPALSSLAVGASHVIEAINNTFGSGAMQQIFDPTIANEANKSFSQVNDQLDRMDAQYAKLSHASSTDWWIGDALRDGKAADAVDAARQKVQQMVAQTDALSLATGTSQDKAWGFITTITNMGGTFTSTAQAEKAYEQALHGGYDTSQLLGESVADTTKALQDQADQMTGDLDPLFAAAKAQTSYQQAQQATMAAIAQYGINSDQAKQANLDMAQAGEQVYTSLLKVKQGMADGSISASQAASDLQTLQTLGLIPTKASAEGAATSLWGVVGAANAIPGSKGVVVHVDDSGAIKAFADIAQWLQYLNGIAAKGGFWGSVAAGTAAAVSPHSSGNAAGGMQPAFAAGQVNESGIEMARVAGKDYLLTSSRPAQITSHSQTAAALSVGNGGATISLSFTYAPGIAASDQTAIQGFVRNTVMPEVVRAVKSGQGYRG